MCGIAGFIDDAPHRRETIERMMERIYHRGPDAGEAWLDEHSGLTFGFRRLAIRDVSANGMQPMQSQDGRYVIVFNGEIYNAAELKKKMEETDGFSDTYRGTSDTEILLNAFCHYGVRPTLQMAQGMFGIALFDRQEKVLYLMRDRYGEKPVYYGRIRGKFVFASELEAIRAFPGFAGEIRRDGLPAYMKYYGYVPAPATIYEGICKLRPGELLSLPLAQDKEKTELYYDVAEVMKKAEGQPFNGTFTEAVDELETRLLRSVEKQMVSDVPLGAYLSGGTDSATVVALMSSLAKGRVKTFSIGFDDKKYDEAPEAKAIAKHLGTEHFEQYVSEKELQDVIPQIPGMYGEPFADSSQIPTYLVSKLAKSQVTVSLSGDAGDELFCGYITYPKMQKLWNHIKGVPGALRAGAGKAACALPTGKKGYRGGLCLQARNILELKEAVDHTDPLVDRLAYSGLPITQERILADEMADLQLLDLRDYLHNDILVKVDRAGMAVSLENRIPMLDPAVVEFAFSLPTEYKYDGVTAKKVLKEVLYRHVPKELMERPKKGFAVPLTKWLTEGHTAQWASELMTDCKAAKDGYLDPKSVEQLWRNFQKNGASSRIVWNVLMLEQWYREQ